MVRSPGRMRAQTLAWAAIATAVLAACSSGESPTGATGGAGGSGGAGTGGEACAKAADCTACTTEDACLTCCDDANQDAHDALLAFLVEGCICAASAPCKDVCAD